MLNDLIKLIIEFSFVCRIKCVYTFLFYILWKYLNGRLLLTDLLSYLYSYTSIFLSNVQNGRNPVD